MCPDRPTIPKVSNQIVTRRPFCLQCSQARQEGASNLTKLSESLHCYECLAFFLVEFEPESSLLPFSTDCSEQNATSAGTRKLTHIIRLFGATSLTSLMRTVSRSKTPPRCFSTRSLISASEWPHLKCMLNISEAFASMKRKRSHSWRTGVHISPQLYTGSSQAVRLQYLLALDPGDGAMRSGLEAQSTWLELIFSLEAICSGKSLRKCPADSLKKPKVPHPSQAVLSKCRKAAKPRIATAAHAVSILQGAKLAPLKDLIHQNR